MGLCSRPVGGEKPSKENKKLRARPVETSRSMSEKILVEHKHPLNEEDEDDFIETKNCLNIWKSISLRYFVQSTSVKQLFRGRRSSKYNGESYVELNLKAVDGIPMPLPLWKPSWRCFTNDEIRGSTNNFHADTKTPVLEWSIRYKVAIGTARGLHYLHKCCQRRIIHRDIKSSNVLLGTDFEPQISDFGLSKWLPRQWTHHFVTPIEGTFGRYLAPEYFLHGIVDEKTDVYSFGVLLLEIISGRRPIDASEQNIMSWAKPLMESGNIHELVDPRLRGQYDIYEMQRMVLTASLCIRHSAIWRPSMIEVLQLLIEGQSDELADCWKMPTSLTNEDDDDFWGFEESEAEIAATNGAI